MPRHSSPRLPRAGIDPIGSVADALCVFSLALTRPLRHETIAMLLDSSGRGHALIHIDGTVDPFSIVHIADTMAMSAAGNPDIGGLVLASVRPVRHLGADDQALWRQADEVVEAAGLVLYDWLLISPGGTLSMVDDLGQPARWPVTGSSR